MPNGLRPLLATVLLSQAAGAQEEPSAAVREIARAQGLPVEVFAEAKATRLVVGWQVSWSRSVGEGSETCTSRFRVDGSLATLDCSLEYFTHAMGPENSKVRVQALRTFDPKGELTATAGQLTRQRTRDGKRVEHRRLTAADEALADLSKPLLVLPLILQR